MILDVLVFALGFMVSGLLALAALPAVWRRALRLSGERLSRLVPLSADEVAAERDHLRAGHAVELRRSEQRFERADAERATLRVEAGRRETRIVQVQAEMASWQARVAERDGEIAALRRDSQGLWAEIGAEAIALHGLSDLAERRLGEVAALQAERDGLRDDADRLGREIDRGRSGMAGLETRLVGAETRNEDLHRELAQATRELSDERKAAAAAARDAVLERDVARGREAAALAEATASTATRDPDAGSAEAHAREVEALRLELAFMVEQAASAERRATDAVVAGEALRAGRPPTFESDTPPPRPSDGDAGLRAAIAALAEDVLRATRPA